MTGTAKVAVIIGSTRPVRIGPQVAKFVRDSVLSSLKKPDSFHSSEARACPLATIDILDLKDYSLPIFDEPIIPNRITSPDNYTHEHTRRWARTIASYNGYIFVSAQRNWGIPAELKNGIDFLFNEWKGKPMMIVTYGGHGGVQCGEQLRVVVGSMGMRVADTTINMAFPSADFRERAFRGEDVELDASNGSGIWIEHREQIAEVFWNDLMPKMGAHRLV